MIKINSLNQSIDEKAMWDFIIINEYKNKILIEYLNEFEFTKIYIELNTQFYDFCQWIYYNSTLGKRQRIENEFEIA